MRPNVKSIRFIKAWRRNEIDSVNTTLAQGLMASLVQRNIAVWVEAGSDEGIVPDFVGNTAASPGQTVSVDPKASKPTRRKRRKKSAK